MRQLLPSFSADVDLPSVYAYPDGEEPWVRANFVSTLDGSVTGPDGSSASINTPADKQVFSLLRALADVVIVGAGTARAEGYRPPTTPSVWRAVRSALGLSGPPALAVATRSGDLPPLLADTRSGGGDVLLLTCSQTPDEAVERAVRTLGPDRVIVCGDDRVDLDAASTELARRGLRRMLCEGGPHLMHDLAASGALDELCLTLVPRVLGGAHPRLVAGDELDLDLVPYTLLEAEGALLGRWVRADRIQAVRNSATRADQR